MLLPYDFFQRGEQCRQASARFSSAIYSTPPPMSVNFVRLTTTTPALADAIAYHLRQILKQAPLEDEHILTVWVETQWLGAQVEVRISQIACDWMLNVRQQSWQQQKLSDRGERCSAK